MFSIAHNSTENTTIQRTPTIPQENHRDFGNLSIKDLIRLDEETRGNATPKNPLRREHANMSIEIQTSEVDMVTVDYEGDAAWINAADSMTVSDMRRKIVRFDSGLVNDSKSGGNTGKPIFQVDPHPERRSAEAVIVVHPGGMQVKTVSRFAVQNPQGGGAVGRKVTGRSTKARGRLMRHLIAVDLGKIASKRKGSKVAKCLFLTLTYPWFDGLPFTDHEAGKAHIKALRKRIEAKHGLVWAVWVQESQESGALHFHFVLLLPKVVKVAAFRSWLSKAWYEVVKSGNPDHLKAGTSAEAVYIEQGDPASLLMYLSKEIGGFGGKSYQVDGVSRLTGECLETGKTWGIWGRDAFQAMKVVVCTLRIMGREAWDIFKGNVSDHFSPSKYLSKVSTMSWWGGGLLYGASKTLKNALFEGLSVDWAS